METYFSTIASFRLIETNFLACANHFLCVFRGFCRGNLFFLSIGNIFLNEIFIPAIGEGFFSSGARYFIFLLAKTGVMSGDQFLNTELILAVGN